MGIASLILGILAFLFSFSFFVDMGLILGVLAVVLGIISVVKKKNKGMAIAGIILGILALMVTFSGDETTNGTTGTGVTSDTSNSVQTKVSVSTEKVNMEYAGLTEAGDFVIKVTNNNDGAVCLSDITTVYKDDSGNFAKKVSADQSFVCIPANSFTYVYNWGYDEKFETYPTYEFSCELANISEDFIYNGIDITSNDTGDQIAVILTNNSGSTIESSSVVVLFFRDEKIVGVENGYADETVATGNNAYINVSYPDDSDYDEVSFDKYEVYYTKASLEY